MSIANNKKAFHDFFIEDQLEAGLVLEGWEVKAIRAGRVQLKESYIHWKKGAFYLVGCHITALPTASTHVKPDVTRNRKLLLHAAEIARLIGKVERAGYSLVPLDLHYCKGHFDRIAIVPGVVQCRWALALAAEHLGLQAPVRAIEQLKYQQLLRPYDALTLSLRYDASDDLARIFGDSLADSISERAANIGQTVKKIGQSIAEQISDFSREPESPAIDAATLSAWMEEVDKLRDDVARLNERLDRLERDIWID